MELVKDHIAIFENSVEHDFCDEIVKWFEDYNDIIIKDPEKLLDKDSNNVRDGTKSYAPGHRKDIAYFANLEGAPFEFKLRGLINEFGMEYLNEYPNIKEVYHLSNRELKIQRTPPHGGYHVWHHEHSYDYMARILVWTLYLNDFDDGEAETEFLYQGVKITPKKGKVCIFPAGFTHLHRGNPPYSKDKYIATGWFKAQPK